MILSLVYVGGAILASKRSHYYDLLNAGFDPLVLAERLQRQHKLICAAVKAGRIEDLKRLTQRDADVQSTSPPPPVVAEVKPIKPKISKTVAESSAPKIKKPTPDPNILALDDEKAFHAGEEVTIRIRVSRGGGEVRSAAADVPVTVKVLGSEFRPLILTTRSDSDGVATIRAWLPRFTKGRAAVLVRAALDGFSAELRRVIHKP
ncbi:MAG: hypothetical protein LC802_22660 [Acidobacteria bacterium]|nr:hypothetical protein [Acidobacteriota bacterium]